MVRRAFVQRSLVPRNPGDVECFRGERASGPLDLQCGLRIDEGKSTETWTYEWSSQYVVPATLCRGLFVIGRPRIWKFVEAASLHA